MISMLSKLNDATLQMGTPLSFSIFNRKGELLLKQGRVITTERQLTQLHLSGFIKKTAENSHFHRQSITPRATNRQQEDIFTRLSQWLEKLFRVFDMSSDLQRDDFTHKVLKLALDIQEQCKRNSDAVLAALVMDEHNHYGLIHAIHCAVICEILSKLAGVTQVNRLSIIAGALTHDIGIIEYQDELHRQSAKLNAKQMEMVNNHPIASENLLIQQGVDDPVWLGIARHHHERIDGSGYPDGLSGEELSQPVRIMAIADIYTAVARKTIFRPQGSANTAIKALFGERQLTLDEKLVNSFIKRMGIYPLGSLVRLANNEVAVVTEQNDLLRHPTIVALLSADGSCLSKPIVRDSKNSTYQITGVEPISKFRSIHRSMEQLWITPNRD
jgi:HD-GYP domain-containing protein (c-di-GMP phosphodiesterase class II)